MKKSISNPKKKGAKLPEYIKGINPIDYDDNLTEENCSPECWAYLNRPDEERIMPLEDWQKLYEKRLARGYYDNIKYDNIEDQHLPF